MDEVFRVKPISLKLPELGEVKLNPDLKDLFEGIKYSPNSFFKLSGFSSSLVDYPSELKELERWLDERCYDRNHTLDHESKLIGIKWKLNSSPFSYVNKDLGQPFQTMFDLRFYCPVKSKVLIFTLESKSHLLKLCIENKIVLRKPKC